MVVAIGISWGGMHGYAINPARDLGPRLFTLAAGFRNTGFTDGVFVVPIVGPLLGGLLGALVYDWLIRAYMPSEGAPRHHRRKRIPIMAEHADYSYFLKDLFP